MKISGSGLSKSLCIAVRFRLGIHFPVTVSGRGFSAIWFLMFLAVSGMGCVYGGMEKSDSGISESASETAGTGEAFIPDGYIEKMIPVGDKGYFVKPLAKDVYFFSTGPYNNLFVVTSEGVVITDPIRGKGKFLKKAVEEVTSQPIRYMIYSHPHLDHIGDAHLFAEGVQTIAQVETGKFLRRYKDPKRPVPEVTFGKNYILKLGDIRIELIYPGAGHGEGNTMIYIPQRKILMYVDVATPKSVPFKNFSTVDIYSQVRGIERALKLDFDVYVAGHLHRPGTREEMKEVLEYYYASKKANGRVLKNVSFMDVRDRSRTRDVERLFGEYYEAVAEECYRILKDEWKPRLMGFEAFTRGHCDTWTSFHRTHKAP